MGSRSRHFMHYRKAEPKGADRALVQAATGIGKTYLAAFDSRNYRRVLFVSHRKEILKQAAQSFHNIRPEASIGFFMGDQKDTEADLIFASVESLGKAAYLNEKYFPPDAFSYLCVDERGIIGQNPKNPVCKAFCISFFPTDCMKSIFAT